MKFSLKDLNTINKALNLILFYSLITEQDLSNEDKTSLTELLQDVAQIVKKYSNSYVIGNNINSDKTVKDILKKAAYLRDKMTVVFNTTKEAETEEESKTKKLWDQCEKFITLLQNKEAKSNIEIEKAEKSGAPILNKQGEPLKKNTDWKDLSSVKCFNY